jgi:hypothetical protein
VATIRRTQKRAKPISDKTRAADEKLRDELRQFDLKKFDKLLETAIKPSAQKR